jgi:hypothetical protein
MKKIGLCVILAALSLAFGCSTKGEYVAVEGAPVIEAGALFSPGEITDSTGFKFPEGETDTVELGVAMREALEKALREKGAYGGGAPWTVNVDLVDYAPGNAFARWLLPGAGATRLKAVATVVDSEGARVATVPVERSIGFGGAYTIGAWRYVFDEVAQQIVRLLTGGKLSGS